MRHKMSAPENTLSRDSVLAAILAVNHRSSRTLLQSQGDLGGNEPCGIDKAAFTEIWTYQLQTRDGKMSIRVGNRNRDRRVTSEIDSDRVLKAQDPRLEDGGSLEEQLMGRQRFQGWQGDVINLVENPAQFSPPSAPCIQRTFVSGIVLQLTQQNCGLSR